MAIPLLCNLYNEVTKLNVKIKVNLKANFLP